MDYLRSDFPHDQIPLGKYTRWAENLSKSRALELLALLGHTRRGLSKTVRTRLSSPPSSPGGRLPLTILSIGEIMRTNLTTAVLPGNFQEEFSPSALAFSDDFQDILRSNPDTAWAEKLTQRSWAMMLWMVDEFKCRFEEDMLSNLMSELGVRDKIEVLNVRHTLIALAAFRSG